ncbi:MAG TPA: hypothetical protein VNO33_21120 [Kofleriaceae bacterium]|nr:hypothetical protein [Kofleriaceae bacterium]
MRRLAAIGLAVSVVALAGGCGGGAAAARDPAADGVSAYLDALRSDDARRAYSLLTDDVRKEISYDAFAAQWKEQRAERLEQARALEQDLRGGADLGERARVTFPDGKTLSLHRQSGSWRMEVPLLSRAHAATPHVAVELFAEALTARDYEAVMRILTARRREGVGRQVDDFVASLARHLGEARHTISFVGKDRAELQWDDGEMQYKVVLRLEGEEWRVDDVHARPVPPAGEEEADKKPATPAPKR